MQQGKYVYYFGDGHAEGSAKMKDILGGKGAGQVEHEEATGRGGGGHEQ